MSVMTPGFESIAYMLRVSTVHRSRDRSRALAKVWNGTGQRQLKMWLQECRDRAGKVVWGQTRIMLSLHDNKECEPQGRNTESNSH